MSQGDLKDDPIMKKEIESYLKKNRISSLLNRTVTISPGGSKEHRIEVEGSYTRVCMTPFPFPKTGDMGNTDDYFMHLKISTSETTDSRIPVDVCCVVDVSGSMIINATVQDVNGKKIEDTNLSILDVVKHAVRTIINGLKPTDRLCIVSFCNYTTDVLQLTYMDDSGKRRAETAVNSMETGGTTHLWDGLQAGMNMLRNDTMNGRFSSCFLLTDGRPNKDPPMGHLKAIQKYRRSYHSLPCTINTFGFGYDIDSDLLTMLAKEGKGNYTFIPDGGFVGTAFVNALSNLLSTFSNRVDILLDPLSDDVRLMKTGVDVVFGNLPMKRCPSSSAMVLGLSSLRFGQSRDVVVPVQIRRGAAVSIEKCVGIVVRYDTPSEEKGKACFDGELVLNDVSVQHQLARLHASDMLTMCSTTGSYDLGSARNILTDCINVIVSSSSSSQKPIQGLLKDLNKQATQALCKKDWFDKWGQYYLPSLAMAHSEQICTNFKDPGLQFYGGSLFLTIQDELDSIFLSLPAPAPAPTPKEEVYTPNYGGNSYQYNAPAYGGMSKSHAPVYTPPARQLSMSDYHCARSGCFADSCSVLMGDESQKKVSDVQRGDEISTGTGKNAKVVCVVKTLVNRCSVKLVKFPDGLVITEYHPVRIDDVWSFPIDLAPVSEVIDVTFVCSLVLDQGHVCIINGVECVCLGHNFTEEVVSHPFFGSEKVIDNLKMMKGWRNGMVILREDAFMKDDQDSLIDGIDLSKEIDNY
uniref:von willebrand factor type A domain protein n=1 Tax=Marseillevirus LCMAC101 TaxID=2506602 RepID=A0A481YSW7_9VIRU|nr:MAG: von willebrand factor type A domain protein [Marseillevirus LCMAC101]